MTNDETILRQASSAKVVGMCEWYLLCTNVATRTEPHPTLGEVPICDRCTEKIRKISGKE